MRLFKDPFCGVFGLLPEGFQLSITVTVNTATIRKLENMADGWLTGLNTATVEHHEHESFSFIFHKFHSISVIIRKHIWYQSAHRLSESISRRCCFFPSHHNSFPDRMIAAQASGADIFVSVVSLLSIGLWQSAFMCAVCMCVCVCVTCSLWGSLPQAAAGRQLRSICEWDRAHLHKQGAGGHVCLFCWDPMRALIKNTCQLGCARWRHAEQKKKTICQEPPECRLGNTAPEQQMARRPAL